MMYSDSAGTELLVEFPIDLVVVASVLRCRLGVCRVPEIIEPDILIEALYSPHVI